MIFKYLTKLLIINININRYIINIILKNIKFKNFKKI